MAATIDMNFQSDLMAIFEENLFWRARGSEELLTDSSARTEWTQKAVREKDPIWPQETLKSDA